MSTNAQVHVTALHVTARERFSVHDTLGPGGAKVLDNILSRLSTRQFPVDICEQFPWQSVAGRKSTYRRMVAGYDVELSFESSVPKLAVSGVQGRGEIPKTVMRSAHTAVNQVLALAISNRIKERLSQFASQRTSETLGQRVNQTVALKAMQMRNAHLAIRASVGIYAIAKA
jgi:hypothetical protein